jgi:hypothetical protein
MTAHIRISWAHVIQAHLVLSCQSDLVVNVIVFVSKGALVVIHNLSDSHVMDTCQIEQAIPRFERVWRLLATRWGLTAHDTWAFSHMYMLMQPRAMHRTFVNTLVEKIFIDLCILVYDEAATDAKLL